MSPLSSSAAWRWEHTLVEWDIECSRLIACPFVIKSSLPLLAQQMSDHASVTTRQRVVGVRVACRVRPLDASAEAFATLHNKIIYCRDPEAPMLPPQAFSFDCSFDAQATNAEVYEEVARPVLRQAMEGYNGTIFAYGQTASGKTHTMHGWGEAEAALGIVPRLSRDLFRDVAARAGPSRFLVTASYLEIYNEQLVDLFNPSDRQPRGQKVPLCRSRPQPPAAACSRLQPPAAATPAQEAHPRAHGCPDSALAQLQPCLGPGTLAVRQHPQHGVFVPELAQLVVRSELPATLCLQPRALGTAIPFTGDHDPMHCRLRP